MKINCWLQTGELWGCPDTEEELLETAGGMLDGASAGDITGLLVFQTEDGKWKVGTVEFVIADADPDFIEGILADEIGRVPEDAEEDLS